MNRLGPILQFVKKNLYPLIFALVAILAATALYWPINGMYTGPGGLSDLLAARVDVGQKIDTIVKAPRQMPLLTPDQTNQDPLLVFPRQDVIDAATKATDQVQKEADGMLNVAVLANTHSLLTDKDELPAPDEAARYKFAKQYVDETTNLARWQKMLNSGTIPTQDEIEAQKKVVTNLIQYQHIKEAEAEIALKTAAVPGLMQVARAHDFSVYMQPDALTTDSTITVNNPPSPNRICSAQIALWATDDIISAIARANQRYSDSVGKSTSRPNLPNVYSAAIKRIVKIDPALPVISPDPTALTTGDGSPVPKTITASPSGRVCNALFDVLRYNVNLIVDASKLNDIIRELEAGQFITVMNVQVNEITDPGQAAAAGYRYGNKAMLNVTLDCEELLMRQWTTPLLPDMFKNGLGKGQPVTDQVIPDPNAPPAQ